MTTTRLAYGAGAINDYPWHLDGSKPWTSSDSVRALSCLAALPGLGIEWVDTAARYGDGLSESLVGAAEHTAGFNVITKVGLSDKASFLEALDASYARHKRAPKCVLLHNPDLSERVLVREILGALKSIGVPYYGISTEPVAEAEEFATHMNAVQFPYSIVDERAEETIFKWADDKFFRMANRVLGGPCRDGELNKGYVKSALKFVSWCEKVDVAIVGTTNLDHLAQCAEIVNGTDRP